MIKMRNYLFLLFALLSLSVDAQVVEKYTIKGELLDSLSGTTLQGATIFLPAIGRGTVTDDSGFFTIQDISAGEYKVQISHLGYTTRLIEINLDRDVELYMYLQPSIDVLHQVTVTDNGSAGFGIDRLRSVENVAIYAAKKNEVIEASELVVNKASNTSRQIYAKVSGLNIWESDGAGVQLGIGGRGLSPTRNSNFNTRQNGYDISADALGYPESYYTPPIEAIDRIEIVRGAASLQYGTQFGGMINFKFKEGPDDRNLALSSKQTVGSFGFFNSFNSLGGTVDKLNYYTFYQRKVSDGWRPNSSIDQHTGYAGLSYQLSKSIKLKGEYTHTQYVAQQPGGLTDAQFEMNPRQSLRERNWFQVNWNLAALTLDYRISDRLKINSRTFGLIAGRDALGNLDPINLLDFGDNRDLLSDDFRNWGNETRIILRKELFDQPTTFLVGARYYQGRTLRRQGEADNGSGPRFTYLHPENLEGSDFILPSRNVSLFSEALINVNEKFSIIPGARFEYIQTKADGYYRSTQYDLAGNIIADELVEEYKEHPRSFAFFGLGMGYKINESLEVYSNLSQNYRAINFNDIRVNVGSLVVDEDLRDERGFNFDLGIRGKANRFIDFDATAYFLSYNDRIGTVLKKEPNPQFNGLVDRIIRFRTNVADARIFGLESLIEINLSDALGVSSSDVDIRWYSNFSLTHGTYEEPGNEQIDGKDVELVPPLIWKSGLQVGKGAFTSNVQFGYVKEHFSDASNAILTPSAIEGVIPSYHTLDWSLQFKKGWYVLDAGVNNMLDAHYFTRRATGYPGPGIIPSDGRSFYFTLGIEL